MILVANQIREALALVGWTPLTLAIRAFLALDDVNRALDDADIRCLGELHLGAIREVLESAGVAFNPENRGASGARPRQMA